MCICVLGFKYLLDDDELVIGTKNDPYVTQGRYILPVTTATQSIKRHSIVNVNGVKCYHTAMVSMIDMHCIDCIRYILMYMMVTATSQHMLRIKYIHIK